MVFSSSYLSKINPWAKVILGISLMLVSSASNPHLVAAQSQNLSGNNVANKSYWDEQIVDLEVQWQGIYENYFREDFSSLGMNPAEISKELAHLNKKTGKKPAVLWMNAKPDGLFLFLIVPNQPAIATRVIAADSKSLATAIEDFLLRINNPKSTSYLNLAQQLYRWTIAPIEYHLLRNKIDTLILCVGPRLRSFPFAALHDGKQFLVEKYAITRIPGYNLTQWNLTKLNQAKILAMGASEFATAEPLPGVAVEMSRITPTPWEGVSLLNQDFTLANFKKQRQRQFFPIVHLATHAKFNPGSPSNSYIQFANSRLNLQQMRELNWSQPPVELLVLSACTTALGDEAAELGFVGLAVHSGVKSAIGSLWLVSDIGTVAMMSEFYWQLKEKLLKAEALRQAQIAMIRGKITLSQGQLTTPRDAIFLPPELANFQNIDLSHPYYWAGFSLVGNPF